MTIYSNIFRYDDVLNVKATKQLERIIQRDRQIRGIEWKECRMTSNAENQIFVLFAIDKFKVGTFNYAKSFSKEVLLTALQRMEHTSNTAKQMVLEGKDFAVVKVFQKDYSFFANMVDNLTVRFVFKHDEIIDVFFYTCRHGIR